MKQLHTTWPVFINGERFWERGSWTVTLEGSEVTQTWEKVPVQDHVMSTFHNKSENCILRKVAQRSRDSRRTWRYRRQTVKHLVLRRLCFIIKWEIFDQKLTLNGHAIVVGDHATVGRLSNDDFSTFQPNSAKFWKKSLNGHETVVGGHATVGRLSNNFISTFQAKIGRIFRKKSLNGRATVVGGHATVGRLSNTFKPTFQQKWWNFEE